MRHKIQRIHFVGIGGAGMCGLAEVMLSLGYGVSGSDLREQTSLDRLRTVGAEIFIGHDAAHAAAADCVVYSSAVLTDNPERQAAVSRGVPVIPRAQMLGEVLRFKPGVAVAGTHGKTTVSSMLAAILAAAGQDPTCIIGGCLQDGGGNARIGDGEFVVVEADESDASFLHLQPVAAVITNIDNDHLPAFDGEISKLREAFVSFANNLPFYGAAIVCADDAGVAAMAAQLTAVRVITYGFADHAEVCATAVRATAGGMDFILRLPSEERAIHLPVAGRHNVQNAAGACAAAWELGADVDAMVAGLGGFHGVRRRLEGYGEIAVSNGMALLIDDYAHHPTEIDATLAALRGAYPGRRLLLVFQPHRYTRTRDVWAGLVASLAAADELLLLDVYPAGEEPIRGADSNALASALHERGAVFALAGDLAKAQRLIYQHARADDVIVTMGAGSIGTLPAMLREAA